jgi:hypothetical protein
MSDNDAASAAPANPEAMFGAGGPSRMVGAMAATAGSSAEDGSAPSPMSSMPDEAMDDAVSAHSTQPHPNLSLRPHPNLSLRPHPNLSLRPHPNLSLRPHPILSLRPHPNLSLRPHPNLSLRPHPNLSLG